LPFGEEVEYPRDNDIEVRREAIPPGVAVRLQVRPLVVQVERERRRRFAAGAHPCRGDGDAHAGTSASSSATARSASWSVSFTFSVPCAICDVFTTNRPGTDVRIVGMFAE